jgi:predicted nuclease of predicted toxin-antitoxin system
VKVLLDENFPLPLYHRLRQAGHDVEHIIVLGQRGASDDAIRARLAEEQLAFLTNDTEFEERSADYKAQVIISRVPQSLPTRRRVQICFEALERFMKSRPPGRLFDLLETGQIVPWKTRGTQ